MKKYAQKQEWDVQAGQWFKHGDVPGLAVDPDNPDNAILNPDDQWDAQILKPGDYYCVHRLGDVFILSKVKFERRYREWGDYRDGA